MIDLAWALRSSSSGKRASREEHNFLRVACDEAISDTNCSDEGKKEITVMHNL